MVFPISPVFTAPKSISHNGRTFQLSWNYQPEDPEWDDFLIALPDGHHEQTSRWGQVRALLGWRILRLVLRENGQIIGGAQLQLRRVKRLGQWAYVTFGPCLRDHDSGAGRVLLAEVKQFLRAERVIYLLAQLPYEAESLGKKLLTDGFIPAPRALAPSNMRHTLLLDLARSEAELLAGMRASTRHQIRQGLNRGLTVEPGGKKDLDEFWVLMRALCQRRRTTPNPSTPEFFHELWKQFAPRGWVRLFVAKHEGRTAAAALAFTFGNWFRVWKVGWAGDHARMRPNQILWWSMIRCARQEGFKHFDFVNLDLDPSGKPLDGSAEFKLGFGGTVKSLPGVYCHFVNPVIRTAMRTGLAKVLNADLCITLARNLARRR